MAAAVVVSGGGQRRRAAAGGGATTSVPHCASGRGPVSPYQRGRGPAHQLPSQRGTNGRSQTLRRTCFPSQHGVVPNPNT
eukprot:gene17655-biopygen11395